MANRIMKKTLLIVTITGIIFFTIANSTSDVDANIAALRKSIKEYHVKGL